MKKFLTAAVVSVALSSGAFAQVPITNVITNAFDFGANYGGVGEPGWTNGANAGTGFGAWTISVAGAGSRGNFIGNPSNGGIGGMSTESFGLFAHSDATASVTASRSLSSALAIGQTFSFQWGINWDGEPGSKGFRLLSGATEIVTITNAGFGSGVTINGSGSGLAFGTNSFYLGITRFDANTYTVFSSSSRDNPTGGGFTTNISSALAADTFQLFANDVGNSDNRQPYYNDFSVTAVPEPSTYALLALSAAGLGAHLIRRRRR